MHSMHTTKKWMKPKLYHHEDIKPPSQYSFSIFHLRIFFLFFLLKSFDNRAHSEIQVKTYQKRRQCRPNQQQQQQP